MVHQAKPDVTVNVRHKNACPSAGRGGFYHKCDCPKFLRYSFGGKQHNFAAGTRSWDQAEIRAKEKQVQLESDVDTTIRHGSEKKTIKEAVEVFLTSKESEGIGSDAFAKNRRELERFELFMSERSRFYPGDIRLEDLVGYRAGWEGVYKSSQTRAMVQTRLRGFLRFCVDNEWMTRLPKLKPIKVDEVPTLPLSESEYDRLLQMVPKLFDEAKAPKVRALIQLMRHSGLAIRDAVTLERSEIVFDPKLEQHRIVTSRQKTGTHVSVMIPPAVAKEVLSVLNGNERYVFWNTGTGLEQSAVTNWQHDLRRLFRGTFGEKTDFTPHCLRDTAAMGWLSRGMRMEVVSKMLGHTSIKTTEKSYAKWDTRRQDNLDSELMATWEK
jgi:integrase/recombinase XerD